MSLFQEDTRPNIRCPSAISVGLTGMSLAFSSLLSCSPSFESALCSLVAGFKMLPKMDYGVKSKWDKKIPAISTKLQGLYMLINKKNLFAFVLNCNANIKKKIIASKSVFVKKHESYTV